MTPVGLSVARPGNTGNSQTVIRNLVHNFC